MSWARLGAIFTSSLLLGRMLGNLLTRLVVDELCAGNIIETLQGKPHPSNTHPEQHQCMIVHYSNSQANLHVLNH